MLVGREQLDPLAGRNAKRSELDHWMAEYLLRKDAGETLDREAFLAECPEALREEMAQLLDTADLIDSMAGPPLAAAAEMQANPADQITLVHHPSERTASGGTAWLAEPHSGERFGDYELLEVIGRGGMGVVFKARQISLNRICAVKMILAGRFASREDIQRFYAEAQAAGKVDHPNIVTIYQVGEIDGRHFFSMDLIEGPNLADLCANGPMEPRRAARYLETVARAVDVAHRQGILHRDLKPANILIDVGDRPCVTDFGLAKHLEADFELTSTGIAIGTPSYMPPEQATGQWDQLGPASDVYSLGAILYVLLTGQPPFRASTALDTIYAVVHNEPRRPRELNPSADVDLETICLKCLEKDPAKRYATAEELADDLARYLRGEPIQARPIGRVRRLVYWTLGIPIVAALVGRHPALPTVGQRRAQAALVLTAICAVVALGLWMRSPAGPPNRLPARIRIAAGREGGMYDRFAKELAESLYQSTGREVLVGHTSGSIENSELVTSRKYHLGLLQAGAMHGDEVTVIAPVFYEVVHVVVRADRPIEKLEDLRGRWICLGEPGSGMRLTAEALAKHFELPTDSPVRDYTWSQFLADEAADAAIVTLVLHSEPVTQALATGRFRLVSLPSMDDWDDPTLERCHFSQSVYPEAIREPEGWETVRTPAFLVTHPTAPPALVHATLDAFYQIDNPACISRATAASWTFLPWHRAAREYLDRAE